jgi:hypothetical protein
MASVEASIPGCEKLVNIFGYWPSFHDAEVLELHLLRGNVQPEKGMYEFPSLTLNIHLWRLTKEVDAKGYLVLRDHTLTTLKFTDVAAEFQMQGFNHQNAMMSLSIERRERSEGTAPLFAVTIAPAFGMGASFECLGIEVVDAVRCTEDGQLIPVS